MDVQHALESHPSINGMCDYVGISRSGYYQREKRHNHQSPRKLRKKFIQGEIKVIWLKSLCIYGAGKITQELRSKGYKIAERTVGKYMCELGIHAVYLTPWTGARRSQESTTTVRWARSNTRHRLALSQRRWLKSGSLPLKMVRSSTCLILMKPSAIKCCRKL